MALSNASRERWKQVVRDAQLCHPPCDLCLSVRDIADYLTLLEREHAAAVALLGKVDYTPGHYYAEMVGLRVAVEAVERVGEGSRD